MIDGRQGGPPEGPPVIFVSIGRENLMLILNSVTLKEQLNFGNKQKSWNEQNSTVVSRTDTEI